MATTPDQTVPVDEVLEAYKESRLRVTRRIQLFESDGVTPWSGDNFQERLVEGDISIDGSRDERRSLNNLLLSNKDNGLKLEPGGLWYDKIVKVFRGLIYNKSDKQSDILVAKNMAINPALEDGTLTAWWANGVPYNLSLETTTPLSGTTSVLSTHSTTFGLTTNVVSNIFITNGAVNSDLFPTVSGQPFVSSIDLKDETTGHAVYYNYERYAQDKTYLGSTGYILHPLRTTAGVTNRYAFPWIPPDGTFWTRLFIRVTLDPASPFNVVGNEKVWYDRVNISGGSSYFDGSTSPGSGVYYSWEGTPNSSPSRQWRTGPNKVIEKRFEIQIGEFMLDSLNTSRFPNHVQISGRDYTKKLLLDQFAVDTTFAAGQPLDTIVKTIATVGGIRKFRLGSDGVLVNTPVALARKTSRWEGIKNLCEGLNIEVYFDAEGFLVTRPYDDVITSPPYFTLWFDGENKQNIIDYNKSSSDANIFNHIVVTGTSEEETVTGYKYIAVRENTDPSSATSIAKLGRRTFPYEVSYITSQQQANDLADRLMAVKQLEDFNLSFQAVCYPWLEVNRVLQFDDPDETDTAPTRFMLSSFGIPLGLGPMSGEAKRIRIIGKPDVPVEEIPEE